MLPFLHPLAVVVLLATIAAAPGPSARASGPAPSQELTLRSADGSHVAHMAQLTEDPRPARRSMWQLSVSEDRGARGLHRLWSIVGPEPDPACTYLVADDGSAVCRVDPRFDPRADAPDLVEVWQRGRRSGGFDAKRLAVQLDEDALRANPPRWIAPASDTLRLRAVRFGTSSERYVLDLLALDGGLRTIDLSNNDVVVSADASRTSVRAEPEIPAGIQANIERVFVRSWSAPEEVAGNLGFEVRIRGSFPTPGWRIVGFGVELREDDEGSETPLIAVTPYAARLEGGAAQAITHFDQVCTLVVPQSGLYRLEVQGRETTEITQMLEVLPTALYVSLGLSGGIAGIRREIVVHRDGRLTVDGRMSLIPTDAFAELVSRVDLLPSKGRTERSLGNDMFQYDLAWVPEGRVERVTFDDGTLISPWRDVVTFMTQLAAAPDETDAAPRGYTIVADESEFLVRTGTSGLLKPLSHKHTIKIGEFKGEVVARPEAIEQATMVLIVESASLGVIEAANAGDQRAIDKKLHEEVLDSKGHTQIVFRSTRVEAKEIAKGQFETVIDGDVTLRGITRSTRLSARVEFSDEGLRALGKGSLLLSHFGLEAPKALGGTINVADKVELRFDIVAR